MWLDEVYNLEDKFILSRYLYGIGQPTIDDRKYTTLLKMMQEEGKLQEYTSRSWSSDPVPVELLKKYGKEDLIRNIVLSDKTESIPSINSYEQLWEELGKDFTPGYLSEKKDGWNFQHTYDSLGRYVLTNTRGRSCDPILKDHLVRNKDIPEKIDTSRSFTVVGEGTLTNADFEELKRRHPELPAESQRSSVSTVLANPEDTDLLTFSAFQIKEIDDPAKTIELLHKWNFRTPHFKLINSYQELLNTIEEYGKNSEILSDSTDGLVFWSIKGGFRRAIRVGHWEEVTLYSYVTGYTEQWNTTYISPSIDIYPIKAKGGTRRHVNITNWSRIVNNDLVIGSPIAFIIKSDATADIDEAETRRMQEKYMGFYSAYQNRIHLGKSVR